MIARKLTLLAATAALLVLAFCASAQAAAPAWHIKVSSELTNFAPNTQGDTSGNGVPPEYLITATNIGSAPTDGSTFMVTNTLPAGITEHGSGLQVVSKDQDETVGVSSSVLGAGESTSWTVVVDVGDLLEGTSVMDFVTISGGGAPAASAQTLTTISSEPPANRLQDGSGLRLSDEDGVAVTQAGSHPYEMTLDFALPTVQTGNIAYGLDLSGVEGGLRDLSVTLPRGIAVNLLATPVRCTEAELETDGALGGGCPAGSQVGMIDTNVPPIGGGGVIPVQAPLYSMVPPPGVAAEFGFDAALLNFFIHIKGGVHAENYSLGSDSNDILALAGSPLVGIRAQLWGDPSGEGHDAARFCQGVVGPCAITRRDTPLLTMPTECRETLEMHTEMDSWRTPGIFRNAAFPATDASANETGTSGCNALGAGFNPSIQARPTTTVADSPSGLSFALHVPQSESLATLATAHLKTARVALPEGMVLNPASANGLGSCSLAQIGIDPHTGVPNGNPVSCPDASRIGDVEVQTPLLDHPLPGSVYIATPFENPFDSLLAIYVAIDDPQSGTLVKLAGHVEPDPSTGRLVTIFDQNPQLPFTDFKLEFKGGAHGVLRTPATCGTYSTTSEMTPWSAPDSGPPATPQDEYAISQGPSGACASTQGALPNSPSFDSGAASPLAGAHSPFVLHLRRDDATQNFSAVNVSPPPGLTAKLAGTSQCSDAALSSAASESGRAEQASPSCPASSAVGSIVAGAGAGPSPYYAPGMAYLAGPYKGAPLSLAFVVPAVAGPYDLGTVVTRAAVYLDSTTGRVTTVSDPLPTILQGIPLDVRSVDVSLDRPDFTRNGTSCDPMSVDGSLTSTLGQIAPLSERFQLSECANLPFKPKLSIRLFGGTKRGAHPALRGEAKMPEGGANIAKASVALPHSEFLDQAHIGTVCTRVQFAEGAGNGSACPAASIYGHATATSPLVDYPLEGDAILRSSSHELPDLVVALHGPPSQPIAVNVVGRVDSIRGGIRTTFEGVPDLPVSTFVLNMQGGKKGLLQNSTDICQGTHKAAVQLDGQNGKFSDLTPALKNGKCAKAKHKRHHRRAGH